MKDIITHFDPTIELIPIKIPDSEFGSDGNPIVGEKSSKKAGAISPFIVINGMTFSKDRISFFELDLEDFLPVVTFSIKEVGGTFINRFYPTDGDVASILIRSTNPDFKPIRQDYRITNIDSIEGDGTSNTYTMRAILNVPHLFVDKIKSYNNKTTWKVLSEIAKELNLGFCSNEYDTNDSMNRICPNVDYVDFMLNDLVPSAYKDEDSFFICFIDQYYYLNFVEVNQLLKDNDFEKLSVVTSNYDFSADDPDKETQLEYFYLTNAEEMQSTPNFISAYTMVNNSGAISLANGYRNYVHYYDKDAKEFKQFFLETLNDPNTTSEKIILKGNDNEKIEDFIRSLNFNNQFNSNVHKDYYYAKLHNNYNLSELSKINLLVNLSDINPVITKYKIVPVQIINKDYKYRDMERRENEDDREISVNKFISDYYIARNLKYFFDSNSGSFFTKVILSKREFFKPKREVEV